VTKSPLGPEEQFVEAYLRRGLQGGSAALPDSKLDRWRVTSPHDLGYRVAAMEIWDGIASHASAQERGLYPGNGIARAEWDRGYGDCVCAHRLGHDVREMVAAGLHLPSLFEMSYVVSSLLDGTWHAPWRPDPRGEGLERPAGPEIFRPALRREDP